MMSKAINVFISYSWESNDHKDWVRNLAERLIGNGVHVFLDQWDVQYGESLTQFMEAKLSVSDFVLLVCTPTYAKKSIFREGGVGYEAQIISASIAASLPRSKFVPIVRYGSLRPGLSDCAIPAHFFGILAIDMRDDEKFEMMFENLLRHIYGQPALQRPKLGVQPSFASVSTSKSGFQKEVRLATYEIEKWALISGTAQNERHPDTFAIPDQALRRSLKPGNVVKLMFDYIYPKDHETHGFTSERMWVEIVEINGPYYIGKLRNEPVCVVNWHELEFNSLVVFLPEHVIDVEKSKPAKSKRSKAGKGPKRNAGL